jgi:hypothetical protein
MYYIIHLSSTLLHTISDDQLFIKKKKSFHMLFNNLSLFMSMSNLI